MPARRSVDDAGVGGRKAQGGDSSPTEGGVLEQFLEFAPDAIVGVDRDGAIALVNQQTEQLFGYSSDELVGKPDRDPAPRAFPRAAHRPSGALLRRPADPADGRRARAATGFAVTATEFPAEISLSSIDPGGEPMGIAAVRDMTDRVEAEREQADAGSAGGAR